MPPRLLDEHLVLIGGLLHDIGTYRVFKHDGSDGEPLKFSKKRYILHGLKGYEYLLDEGVDESIAQFCRNHTGVGLTREEVPAGRGVYGPSRAIWRREQTAMAGSGSQVWRAGYSGVGGEVWDADDLRL